MQSVVLDIGMRVHLSFDVQSCDNLGSQVKDPKFLALHSCGLLTLHLRLGADPFLTPSSIV